ncbi:MAG TPA: delta-60 repeat domain-containing protein, partial [Pyrinomonadaceae bacterium]|nr:delta-60 repeat domain-containing protein [Pyrinomonadaceae bacterium]
MKRKLLVVILTTTIVGSFCFVLITRALSAPGDLDTTFNSTGFARVGFGGGENVGQAVLVQGDGKVVVAGSTTSDIPHTAMLRYNTDGSLDTTFGGVGRGKLPPDRAQWGAFNAVRIQADNKIVAAGYLTHSIFQTDEAFQVARFNADGSFDQTFGIGGQLET